jgi:intein/homing endonuclease
LDNQKKYQNAQVAEILGAFIGDGWIEKSRNSFYIMGNPTEDKEYYDKFLAPLFSKYFIQTSPKSFSSWGVYGIVSYKKKITEIALSLGFESGKKCYTTKIPEWVMKSENKDILTAVLRGIFDTDGCFFCKKAYGAYDNLWTKEHHCKPRIDINTVSKKLLEQITWLLQKLCIEYKTGYSPAKNRNHKNNSEYYRLYIWKLEAIEKWFKVIGTNNPRQKTRYDVWRKLGCLPPKTTIEERKKILSQ